MNVFQCFTAKLKAGTVPEVEGRRLLEWLDGKKKELAEADARLTDAAGAFDEWADEAAEAALRQADLARRQVRAQLSVLKNVAGYEQQLGVLREQGRAPLMLSGQPGRRSALLPAVRAMLTKDRHQLVGFDSVETRAAVIRGQAHAGFTAAIEYLRPKWAGLKNEAAREFEVLEALFGRSDGQQEARLVAEAFGKVSEMLRERYNAAGGQIPKRETWRLPQSHDADKVNAVQREAWKAFVKPLLAREDMLDFATGKPLLARRLDEVLDQVFDSIVTRGLDDPPTAGGAGRPALANSRADHRVLSFRSADAWRAYHERFGDGAGVFDIMMSHIEGMARDIAQLEILGPNPAATRRYIEAMFAREAQRIALPPAPIDDAKAQKATAKANARIAAEVQSDRAAFNALWSETVSRDNRIPVDSGRAHSLGTARALLVASQMGSAILSSVTDLGMVMMAARMQGIDGVRVLQRAAALMADRQLELNAGQAGLVLDSLAAAYRADARLMDETIRSHAAARMATFTIRASGLRRWTASLRHAFALESMAAAARQAHLPFEKLEPGYRTMLERGGMTARDWDAIRAAEPFEKAQGGGLLRIVDAVAADRAAGERYGQALYRGLDNAVIENDPEARAILIGESRPGTFMGEARRAVGMYKSYPLTFGMMMFNTAFARGWDGTRLGYGAGMFLAMSALGIVALQAKQIANGRDPYDLDPTTAKGLRAIGAGIIQGGGFGIFGDFLFTDQTRYGNSMIATLAGPLPGAAESLVFDWALANVQRTVKGQETHFAGDAAYVLGRYVPGSSLFYARLAFQRAVVDQAALMLDPRAPERFRRLEREAAKNWNQDFWWRPGETAPARAPDLAAMFGG